MRIRRRKRTDCACCSGCLGLRGGYETPQRRTVGAVVSLQSRCVRYLARGNIELSTGFSSGSYMPNVIAIGVVIESMNGPGKPYR